MPAILPLQSTTAGLTEYLTMRLPNLACLLCNQYSDVPVCTFCKFDTRFLLQLGYQGNLLRYKKISQQFLPPSYSALRACGEYRWPFDQLIKTMKFQRCQISPAILGNWFTSQCIDEDTLLPDVLLPVPVPLHRFFRRQFNQATELARHIGRRIDRPVIADWARRTGGRSQHTLKKDHRMHNLHSAFRVKPCKELRHVAIIDDVMTTGATANVLAGQLRQHHPDLIIEVWAMALPCRFPLAD